MRQTSAGKTYSARPERQNYSNVLGTELESDACHLHVLPEHVNWLCPRNFVFISCFIRETKDKAHTMNGHNGQTPCCPTDGFGVGCICALTVLYLRIWLQENCGLKTEYT